MNSQIFRITQVLQRSLYFDNWPMVLFQRVFCRNARLLAFRRGQMEFVVDYRGGDQNGIIPCLTGDMYNRFFKLLESRRPLRILDLGANAGGFGLALLAAGFTIEKLVCLEMNRRTFLRLQFNISQNFECDTAVLHAAASGRSGTVTVRDSVGGTNESIYAPLSGKEKVVAVPLITFDDVVNLHFGTDAGHDIDLCKIDIEGAEWEIFQSTTCQTIRRVKHLVIEIHPHPTRSVAELVELISRFGFEVVVCPDAGQYPVFFFRNINPDRQSLSTGQQAESVDSR